MSQEAMQELRRLVDASQHVHALVTAILPTIAAGYRRGPVAWDEVPEKLEEYASDQSMLRLEREAARALTDLGIRRDSDVGVTLMTFASKTATFIVLYAIQIGQDPVQFWQNYSLEFAAGVDSL